MIQQLSVAGKLREYFSILEPELQDLLAKEAVIKEFESGELLMKPGQYFKSSMLITKGRVKVSKQSDEGNEFFMYYLEPGEACALSMICAAKHEKSELIAVAVEPSEAILIPITLMDELMGKYRSWYYFVLETYRKRFEELITIVDHTIFKSLDERLEFYLMNQKKSLKLSELKLTHEEIAKDLGTSRVVISRLLKQMEKDGKVRLHRNSIDLTSL